MNSFLIILIQFDEDFFLPKEILIQNRRKEK